MLAARLIYMQDLERIAANLQRLMQSSGLNTQVKLAQAAGVSQSNLSNILNQSVHPQLDTLAALAHALNVETWRLLAPTSVIDALNLFVDLDPADRQTAIRVLEGLNRSN